MSYGGIPLISDIPNMAPINMISSGGSYDLRLIPILISYTLLVSQDPILLPSSSSGEYLAASNHKIQMTKIKGGRHRKQNPTKKDLASRHHASHHPPSTSTNHVGGKLPTSNHHDGKKLANGYLSET